MVKQEIAFEIIMRFNSALFRKPLTPELMKIWINTR
jgi:hypothetical protein